MSENDILERTKPTTSERIGSWVKSNIIIIVITFVNFLYLGRGFGYIDKTGKTVLQILTDSAISFIFGFLLVSLLGEQGILKARRSRKYELTISAYGKIIELNTPFADKLDIFCDIENAKELKKKQTEILAKEGLSYNRFTNGEYDGGINPTSRKELDEKQLQAIDDARKVDLFKLTRDLLVSEHSNNETFKNLESGLGKYRKKELQKNALSKIFTSILFSYYTIKLFETLDYGAIIWYGLQVVIFLLFGVLQYAKNYEQVIEVERSRFIRKTDLLYVFYNLATKSPEIFKVKESDDNGNNELKDICLTE